MTTMHTDSGDVLPPRTTNAVTTGSKGSVWVLVSGALLAVIGAFNLIHGLTLLDNNELLLNAYLYDNLTFWGWAFVIWGILQAGAGLMAAVTRQRGVTLGVMLCSVSMVGWFFMLFSVPSTAFVAILLNVVIIYGLAKAEIDDMY